MCAFGWLFCCFAVLLCVCFLSCRIPEIAAKAKALKVDAGHVAGCDVGPMISPQARGPNLRTRVPAPCACVCLPACFPVLCAYVWWCSLFCLRSCASVLATAWCAFPCTCVCRRACVYVVPCELSFEGEGVCLPCIYHLLLPHPPPPCLFYFY